MSEENVRVVKAVIDGWLRGDPSTLELIAEDVTYVAPTTMPGEGPIADGTAAAQTPRPRAASV